MSITVIIPLTPIPEFPSLAYRALGTYNSMAFSWAKHIREVLRPELDAMALATYNNAVAGQGFAGTAQSAAVSALAARDQTLAASNFKGEWETLAALPNPADRVLNRPACLKNDGRFWLLLVDLADLATSEPGPSNTDWTVSDQGVTPTALITTNTPAVPGVVYLIGAPDLVLTYPTTWIKGDNTGVVELIGAGTYTIDFGTTKERTRIRGAVVIKAGFRSFHRRYEDTTRGLV